ncbi:MAG: cadherin domain-containing protein, partial [Bacteroidota bacterium]
TYTLVSGSGDTDNASFTIDGNTLKTSSVFDYEAYSNTYSIRVRVTDAGGLTFEKVFTISVTNVNEAPTNIALSPSSISESLPSGTTVGSLASIDVDAGDTFTYTLVSGSGDTDNASFTIDGNTLKTAAVFDYETKSSYSVRVRVTDAGGLIFEKVLTITVTDLDEVSLVITGPGSSTGVTSAISVAENTTAVHTFTANETVTWSIPSGADKSKFAISATGALSFVQAPDYEIPTDNGTNNTYEVAVVATDAAGNASTQTVTVTVTDVDESPVIPALSFSANSQLVIPELTKQIPLSTFGLNQSGATYSLSGPDAALFGLTSNALLFSQYLRINKKLQTTDILVDITASLNGFTPVTKRFTISLEEVEDEDGIPAFIEKLSELKLSLLKDNHDNDDRPDRLQSNIAHVPFGSKALFDKAMSFATKKSSNLTPASNEIPTAGEMSVIWIGKKNGSAVEPDNSAKLMSVTMANKP